MNRIEKIRIVAQNRAIAKAKEDEMQNSMAAYLLGRIKQLAPRIEELLKIARELSENNICNLERDDSPKGRKYFQPLRIRFATRRGGIKTLGVFGSPSGFYNFFVDEYGVVWGGHTPENCLPRFLEDAELFIDEFDEFEKRVFAIVDAL